MIEHLTDKPATVFGNSSGAIVALEIHIHYPERFQKVVAHEPPIVLLLPDAAKRLAFFDEVYNTYRKDGIPKAMRQFASVIAGKGDQQLIERYMTQQANEHTRANVTCWIEHELCKYPRVGLDLDTLAVDTRHLVLAWGRDSQDP